MPAPPPNPRIRLQQPVARLAVLLSQDADPPTEEDEVDWLRPIELVRSSGGNELDYARFEYDLAARNERLIDVQTPQAWMRVVELRTRDRQGRPRGRLLFRGDISLQELTIDPGGESVILTARIEEYHFGPADAPFGLLEGPQIWDPVSELVVTAKHLQIAFNPEIDGRIEPNRSAHRHPDVEPDYALWVDVESVRTEPARTLNNQGEPAEYWAIPEILDTIQRACNPDEDHVKNFEAAESDLFLAGFADPPPVKNLVLTPNNRLPQYLDAILGPYGYGWLIQTKLEPEEPAEGEEEEEDPVPVGSLSIVVYRRGHGPVRELAWQAPNRDPLNLARTNTQRLSVNWDIASPPNRIKGQGSLLEWELTLELYRGWPAALDETPAAELDINREDFDPALVNVWRLWVANEAGDYCELRSGDDPAPIPDTPFDFSSVFIDYVPHRRQIGPCLIRDEDGRIPPVVDYWDETQSTWLRAPEEWGLRVLDDQIGVYFGGSSPPANLIAQGEHAKLRITGTVREDQRLESLTTPSGDAPNERTNVLTLDLGDRFHYRARQETGPLASVLEVGEHGTDVRNDSDELEAYVEQLQALEEPADVRATIELFGLHHDYEIGDLISRVDGRNISLNRLGRDVSRAQYLQISRIRYQFEPDHKTILTVDPLDGVPNA